MPIKLNVPYSEKDEAKALGAKWDPKNKYWYIEDSAQSDKFSKWIENNHGDFGDFRFDEISLLKSTRECYKCKHIGDVYAVVAKGYEIIGTNLGHKGSYKVFPFIYIKESSEFWNHSAVRASTLTIGETMEVRSPHLLCKCPKCKATHGNKFLHYEPNGNFNFKKGLHKDKLIEYIELNGFKDKIVGHSYIDRDVMDHMMSPGYDIFEIKEENGKKLLKNIR